MIELALEGRGLVPQQTVDDLHGFAETTPALTRGRQLDTEPAVLADGVTRTDAKLEPAVRHVIDGDRRLREQPWVAESVTAHQHADANSLGARGERREQGPAFVVGSGLVAGPIEVIAVPDAVVAQRLDVLPTL